MKNMKLHQIIVSASENMDYRGFWPHVSYAYSKMLPGVKIHLAFLTHRDEDDPLVLKFRETGSVTLFKPVNFIPEFAQGKLIRFILASQQEPDEVCYIDDCDIYPLSRDFITSPVERRPDGMILCCGGELYGGMGTSYPISQMTTESSVWKSFINPKNLPYDQLMFEWMIEPVMFDDRENLLAPLNLDIDSYFSDERFLRKRMNIHGVEHLKFEQRRGYENFMESTCDRFSWNVDMEKLYAHGYVNAHCCRPCYPEHMEILKAYIDVTYS